MKRTIATILEELRHRTAVESEQGTPVPQGVIDITRVLASLTAEQRKALDVVLETETNRAMNLVDVPHVDVVVQMFGGTIDSVLFFGGPSNLKITNVVFTEGDTDAFSEEPLFRVDGAEYIYSHHGDIERGDPAYLEKVLAAVAKRGHKHIDEAYQVVLVHDPEDLITFCTLLRDHHSIDLTLEEAQPLWELAQSLVDDNNKGQLLPLGEWLDAIAGEVQVFPAVAYIAVIDNGTSYDLEIEEGDGEIWGTYNTGQYDLNVAQTMADNLEQELVKRKVKVYKTREEWDERAPS